MLIYFFFQRYFTCFDKNRDELLAAYHRKAIFSLSLNVNSRATQNLHKFGEYFKDSRNLVHVPSKGRNSPKYLILNLTRYIYKILFKKNLSNCCILEILT